MTKRIEFFFDFLSPFSYFAHCRLPGLATNYGYELVYKPFSMPAAKHAAGNTGPATPHIPAKFRYICSDFQRWAQRYDIPFRISWAVAPDAPLEGLTVNLPSSGLDTTLANKGMFYAIDRRQARDYADRLWYDSFGSGGLVGSEEVLTGAARQLDWSVDALLDFVHSDIAESRYQANNAEAQRRGVFGAPTMMIGEEMWWGNDRLDFLEEFLAAQSAGSP